MQSLGEINGRRFAVLGFGAEGKAAADFFSRHGGAVTVFDRKPEEDFDAEIVSALKAKGVSFHFGGIGPFRDFNYIVRSPGIRPDLAELSAEKRGGAAVISGTSVFFDLCPARIVGVTGTKGKGTTATLLYEMLKLAGRDARLLGNIGTPALAELEALTVKSVAVYEISSFQLLEVTKSPEVAVLLMITKDHLDFHETERSYVLAKGNIVRFQHPTDAVVANVDNPNSRVLGGMSPAERKLWVSRHHKVREGCCVENGEIILAARSGRKEAVVATREIGLVGPHNLENACAAVAAAELLEVPREVMRQTLRTFKGLPHRLQLVAEANGVEYYDASFSTTPDSAIAAIEAFPGPKVLILGGSPKGADFSSLGRKISEDVSVKAVIGIGEEWPRIKQAIGNRVLGMEGIKLIEGLTTMPEIIKAAAETAGPGDVVLLAPACASFGMFRDYKDRGDQFAAEAKRL